MPSKTRGSIEEGTVNFSHDSEVDVTFAAASIQTKNFNGPPVVKLISASRYHPTLLSNQTNLLFDTDLNFVPTYPSTGVATLTPDISAVSINGGYSGTIGNKSNFVGKAARITSDDTWFTVPFDNSRIKDDSLIQIFFQARFYGWDDHPLDDVFIRFINKATIDTATDSTPWLNEQVQGARYSLFMNQNGDWRNIYSDVDNYYVSLESQKLDDIVADFGADGSISEDWHWFRIDITKAQASTSADVEDIKQFAGINFASSRGSGEYFYVADMSVFVWEAGAAAWDASHNYLQAPVSEITQSNIGVSFTNVTMQGMKVMTTAPFTGVIRYLCSVQG